MRVISSSNYHPSGERGVVFHAMTETTLADALASAAHMLHSASRMDSRAWPRLMVFKIQEPAICLGRFQSFRQALNPEAVGDIPVVSRLTGGPACWVAPGTLYFCSILPGWQSQLNPLLPRTPARVLQKALGDAFRNAFKAMMGVVLADSSGLVYTRQGQEVARMGMDLVSGTLVGEWFLATREKLELPHRLNGYHLARQEPHPPSGCLQDLSQAPVRVDEGFAQVFSETLLGPDARSVQAGEFTYLDRMRIGALSSRMRVQTALEPGGATLYASLPHEEAIGFVHAQVAFNNRLQFSMVRICGDFVADSPGIAELENRLRFTDVNKRNIALIIDEVLGAPDHFILGVKRLGTLLEAILEAAARNDSWNVSQS